MARRSHMSVLKRQREVKKAEKAARKRAKRHGSQIEQFVEPQPTVRVSDLGGESETDNAHDEAVSDQDASDMPPKEDQ